ncbi:DoxX family protein [Halorhabdus rudnickae]|uniref:DoxX family protein n=1 Tax=Halorhabdus rudnickae TaxID=1775544 RepID=UPI001082579C|nr:DoxX family protein [Halorhabdus rudnickae]
MALETAAGGLAFLVGRVVFGVLLGFMGLSHFTGLDGMSGYAEAKGVPAPQFAVILSGFMLIAGGLAIALGVYPLVGAAVIALFFLGVTPVMHDFWTVEDPEQRQAEMTDFLKNATFFSAALVFIAISGTAWPYALNIGI